MNTGTSIRVLPMVTALGDMPPAATDALVSLDLYKTTFEGIKATIDVEVYGTDGWVIFRRDTGLGLGSMQSVDGIWYRHLFVPVKAGLYSTAQPKPAVPMVRIVVTAPLPLTMDLLRIQAATPLPAGCCEVDLDCGKIGTCADGMCLVP